MCLKVHPEGIEPSRFLKPGINQCTLIDYALVKSHMSTNSIMGAYCGEHVQRYFEQVRRYLERQPALLLSLSIVIPVLLCLHHQPGKKENVLLLEEKW